MRKSVAPLSSHDTSNSCSFLFFHFTYSFWHFKEYKKFYWIKRDQFTSDNTWRIANPCDLGRDIHFYYQRTVLTQNVSIKYEFECLSVWRNHA